MFTILAVLDGYKISKSTINYALEMTKSSKAHLVGVFLDEFVYRSYNVYEVMTTNKNYDTVIDELDERDKKTRDEAVEIFRSTCVKGGVSFSIHRDKSIALQELIHESKFADIIIINENETFATHKEDSPTSFIKELLSCVECPVLIVPDAFNPVNKIVLLYDGAASSVHAVKMFSYLFVSFRELPVEVYTVKEEVNADVDVADNDVVKEFITRRFPKATFTVGEGSAEEQIQAYLQNYKENQLVVLGAYGRSELSRWFKTSIADALMRKLDAPLFIAH